MYMVRYYDSLPTHTSILAGSGLTLISNEGLLLNSYTQASDADAGTYNASPAFGYQIRINMGAGAFAPSGLMSMGLSNTTGAGTISPGVTRPLFSSGSIITTAFRVVVTGGYGDTITLGAGKIAYRKSSTGTTDTVLTATKYQILIAQPQRALRQWFQHQFRRGVGGYIWLGCGS